MLLLSSNSTAITDYNLELLLKSGNKYTFIYLFIIICGTLVTDPYWHGNAFISPPEAGSSYRMQPDSAWKN